MFNRRRLAILSIPLLCLFPFVRNVQAEQNVLFIAVDDLRPELGCYGKSYIQSPNIDALAARGLVFDRAYCQQAICMASRSSLMSGWRPDTNQLYTCAALYSLAPDALSMNRQFQANGYETVVGGKIYHHEMDDGKGWDKVAEFNGGWVGRGYVADESKRIVEAYEATIQGKKGRKGLGPAFEAADVPDNAYQDGQCADFAIEQLRRLAKQKDKPFFLAVGLLKPHLPFNAPQKYWDMYDPETIELASNPFGPTDATKYTGTAWGELRGYLGIRESIKKGKISDEMARQLKHGYYACVSYADAQVGKIIDELDRLGLRDDTVIVLWGDHGWKLGEHGQWCKHTNFEIDTRVPLIVSSPGMKEAGKHTGALTESVDIYPTLCELAGIAKPSHLEGTSFAPLLSDAARSWKSAVFSQYPRERNFEVMGYSMRTDRYRYTEWQNRETKEPLARELYDLQQDPEANANVAEQSTELVKKMSSKLNAGWKAAVPR